MRQFVQGFCQSVLNGSNQTLPKAFHLTEDNVFVDNRSLWIYAGLNASVYLTAGLFGCWFSDPLQSLYLGRRGAILFAACLCLASVIGGSLAQGYKQLMVCRALLGLGEYRLKYG